MTAKHILLVALAALVGAALGNVAPARAGDGYRYMSGAELERRLKAHEPVEVLDIQVEPEFAQHHIVGATPTHAYPVKSAEDKAKLDAALTDLRASADPVVIVCPRGAGGAKRTYDYLKAKGIAEERLFILEKGQGGWTCAELTEGSE